MQIQKQKISPEHFSKKSQKSYIITIHIKMKRHLMQKKIIVKDKEGEISVNIII